MVRLVAPNGKKLRNIKTDALYSEVVCDDKKAVLYVIADSSDDPVVETLDGITLAERVADLEDAVIELAGIIGGE